MKNVVKLSVVFLLSIALIACSSQNNAPANTSAGQTNGASNSSNSSQPTEPAAPSIDQIKLVFGTGGTSGLYYPIGGALKSVFEESDYVENVTVEATGASVANLQNIRDGINQVAIVMSDVAYDASKGTGSFEGKPIEAMAIAGLYPNVVQVVARADSGIQTIDDLKGKRVGVGQVGSGVEVSAKIVFEAAGMTYDDLSKVTHTGYADSVQAMKDGNLDAAFFTSGVPNSNITDLQQTLDITFVPIEGEVASNIQKQYVFYNNYTIPAGDAAKYNLEQDLNIVAIKNMLITSPSLDEEIVYELTKRFYDYLGTDGVSVSALKEIDRDDAGNNLVLPLHPGAKKFYEEQGILK